MKKILLCLMMLVLVGCSSYGKPITEDMLSSIVTGETTKTELITMLGQPMSKAVRSDGSEIYTWAYYDTNLLVGKSSNRVISATIQDGVIVDYIFNDMNTPM